MAIVNGSLQVAKKDSAWFTSNASVVLLDGQMVFNETTLELFIGDGVTVLSSLVAINGGGSQTLAQTLTNGNSTGGLDIVSPDGLTVLSIANGSSFISLSDAFGNSSNITSTSNIVQTTVTDGTNNNTCVLGLNSSSIISSNLTSESSVLITPNSTTIQADDFTLINSLSINLLGQTISDTSVDNVFVLTDETNSKGLAYANDYSANFTPESLVTKRYTDALVNTSIVQTITNGDTTHAPSSDVVFDALALKVNSNTAITGATKTKITYDAKGLVTSGADATTADISDSTNKRYVTDANLTVIGNTSGTNTGDQTITLTGDVTGSGTGSFTTTLATILSVLTKGSASKTITLTTDAKGRITALADQDIAIAQSQVTNLVSDLAVKQNKQDYTQNFLLGGM